MVATTTIKKGYKQTEVGVIPEDWDCMKTTDTTTPSANSIKIGPFGSALKKEYLTDKGFKVYGQENVYKRDMSIGDRFISSDYFRELKSCEVIPGDFLISMMGTVGQCMIVPEGIDTGIMDSHLLRIKFDISKINPCFVAQLFGTKIILNQMKQLSVGGIMEGLSSKIIKSIYIPYPKLDEQSAISTVLSDTDALIEHLEKLIAKKKAIKQGTMQQLLTGKKRLPGFGGEWSTISMAKHASLKARIGWQALTTKEYLDIGIYYLVTGTDFIGGRVNWSTCHFVDEWRYRQDRNIQLKDGDVLLTKDGTIGKVGYVENLHGSASLNSGVFVIRPLGEVFVPLFLFYVLTSKIFDEFILKITAGSTITHLYQKDFVSFEFLAPEINEQQAIATILSDMDTEIKTLKQKRDKYTMLKQGMMQQLLTGRIRIHGTK